MPPGEPTLEFVTDLVARMARSDEVSGRVDSMIDLVSDVIGAHFGTVVQADPSHTVVRVLGRRLSPVQAASLSHELELMKVSDPLLDPVSRGDLTPRTAEREFGADAWAASHQRAGCLRYCAADQVCTLPLVGGPDFVIAMFARAGADFREVHLLRLAAIRPIVADMVALAGLRPLPWPEQRPRLTARESEVLVLLARGHTSSRIGRILGTSPRTVEVHLGRIYGKLGVSDRLSAVLAGYDLALIPARSDGLRGGPG